MISHIDPQPPATDREVSIRLVVSGRRGDVSAALQALQRPEVRIAMVDARAPEGSIQGAASRSKPPHPVRA